MRTAAREAVFKIIFASRFTEEIDANLEKTFKISDKLDDDDIKYVNRMLRILSEHEAEILKTVDEHSRDFPESRIFPADKSILMVALAEINYMDDVPPAVSANEAANIASKYSSEKSASFISGILAEIIRG